MDRRAASWVSKKIAEWKEESFLYNVIITNVTADAGVGIGILVWVVSSNLALWKLVQSAECTMILKNTAERGRGGNEKNIQLHKKLDCHQI